MAQAYLQYFAGDRALVYSAGIETHGLNPKAVEIMLEDGLDISHQTSNHIDEYRNIDFNLILTVCDHAQENCPYFPASATRLHHNFTDPSKLKAGEAEINLAFRQTRQAIKSYCKDLIEQYLDG